MGAETSEVKLSPGYLKKMLDLIGKYPAEWSVITSLADENGRQYDKPLTITDPAAKKIHDAMVEAGVLKEPSETPRKLTLEERKELFAVLYPGMTIPQIDFK